MDNTARVIAPAAPAYELLYRMIDGDPVRGDEVLASLGADIEKGYLVGAQSILTLVRDNPLMSEDEIRALGSLLETGAARCMTTRQESARAYRLALRECRSELERRAAQSGKVVPLRG